MTISDSQREHKHLLIADEGETVDQMWARAGQFTNNVGYDCRADYALIKKTGGRKCGPGFDCDKVIERAAPYRIYDLVVSAGSHSAAPTFALEHVTGTPGDFYEPKPYNGTAPVPVPPPVVDCASKFPPRDEPLAALKAIDADYKRRGRPNRCADGVEPLHVDNEGISVWYADYLQRRVSGVSHADAVTQTLAAIAAAWQ